MPIRIDGTNTAANPGITGADADTGLQFGTDEVKILTGGTERVTVDSSGRVLIGTSTALTNVYQNAGAITPQNQFASQGNSYNGGLSLINYSSSGFSSTLSFGQSKTDTLGANVLTTNGEPLGIINFTGNDGTNFRTAAQIMCLVDGTTGSGDMPGRLTFSTTTDGAATPTERVRIESGGTVLIGNSIIGDSSNGQGILVTDGGFIRLGNVTGSGSASMAQFKTGGSSTEVLRFRCDGDIENQNNRYGGISDANLKENIVDSASQWNDIKNICVRKFNFRGDLGYSTHTQIGVIAQELELVCPGLVKDSYDLDENGSNLETSRKSVDYSVLYMKAVKALQEAMTRIETLETQNASLEARLTALEGGAE